MASATRPPRASARTSAQQNTPAQPPSGQHSDVSINKAGNMASRKTWLSNGTWTEPPLRAPLPSFMDHKGLERGGVLDGMHALGARPPTKAKPRPKTEAIRRVGHVKGSASLEVPGLAVMTDGSSPRTDVVSRATSAASEGQESDSRRIPAEQDTTQARSASRANSSDSSLGGERHQHASTNTEMEISQASAASPLKQHLRMAIIRATASNRTQTDQIVERLSEQALRDSGLADLLAAISTDTASQEMKDVFKRRAQDERRQQSLAATKVMRDRRKSQEVRSQIKPQRSSSRQRRHNGGSAQVPSSPPNQDQESASIKLEQPALTSPDRRLRSSPEGKTATTQPKYKIHLRPTSQAITNGEAPAEISHPTVPSIEEPSSLTRRSSTSSLSSVDDVLADAALPAPSMKP